MVEALRRAGFELVRVKGSHHFLRHADGRVTVVPVHAGETVGPGLMGKVLADCEMTRNELQLPVQRKRGRGPTGPGAT